MYEKDPYHDNAMEIENYLDNSNEPTVINTTVIVETLNRSTGTRDNVKELYDVLHSQNIVISLSEKDYLKSLEINGWFNNSMNYSDCTIIKTMIDMGITRIVSFDRSFEKIANYNVICNM